MSPIRNQNVDELIDMALDMVAEILPLRRFVSAWKVYKPTALPLVESLPLGERMRGSLRGLLDKRPRCRSGNRPRDRP